RDRLTRPAPRPRTPEAVVWRVCIQRPATRRLRPAYRRRPRPLPRRLSSQMSSSPTIASPFRLSDLLHPVVAGLISVLVNYGGTFLRVARAAGIAGGSAATTAAWVWSVSIGAGLTGLYLSWRYREPVITAWSTPAAAFLATALATPAYAAAIGAYMVPAA